MPRLTSRIAFLATVAALTAGFAPSVAQNGRSYYAAPTGTHAGNGSRAHPWDLATALAAPLQPGDTLWLRGGVYRGAFRSTLQGSESAPVVVRQYPGERAILDGRGSHSHGLTVRGDYSIFWGFELTNSDPARATAVLGTEVRPDVVVNDASHTKYINLIVHDGGVGFYNEPQSLDVEVAGCVFYNNGWQGPDRGHGHGLYLKSYAGPLVVRDNVVFNQFGYGIHAYTNAGTGKLINIHITGNVSFDNGVLASKPGSAPNILLGGADYASGDEVSGNFTYFPPTVRTADVNVRIGFGQTRNGDVQVTDNYFAGGDPVLEFGFWAAARIADNTLLARGSGPLIRRIDPVGEASASHIWRDNHEATPPADAKIVVRPNPYEAGRAIIIAYNWGHQATVTADLSAVLGRGDNYEIRSVQDVFGAPVTSGTFDGNAVRVPMHRTAPPIPVGMTNSPAPVTAPEFDVFLVTRAPSKP